MEEFGGKINFENITNEMELVVGGKVQLVFRAGEKTDSVDSEATDSKSGKKVSVQKGTKREILQQFNQPSGQA